MSKRIWQHPEISADETTVSWRSAGQLQDTPEFREWLDREFPRGAAEMANADEAETSRRSFLKLMGASTALAGLGMAACRRPEAYLVAYTKAPEWVIPGKATYYASAVPRAHGATPIVVTNFEGRPTHLAPNRLHPDYEGTDALVQASVLDLYSPSRSTLIAHNGKASSLKALEAHLKEIAANKEAKIGFLVGHDDCPTRNRLVGEIQGKFPAAKFYAYEALEGEAAKALGANVKLVPDFTKADRIVALDADFASTDPVGSVIAFFDRRKPEGATYENAPDASSLNRLYSIEAAFSLTGGMADHRLRVAPSQVAAVAAQLARELGINVPSGLAPITDELQGEWIATMAADLKENAGRVAVIAGSRQSAAVHHLALAINAALGNIGADKAIQAYATGAPEFGTLESLTADINAGTIEHLFLLTPSNPVFDAPADLGFPAALGKLKSSIHLGTRNDATAHAATWHVPAAHYLESWSDTRSARGVYSVVQPMILPLYDDCVSELEILAALLAEETTLHTANTVGTDPAPAHLAVRATFAALGDASDRAWKQLLRDGFQATTSYAPATPTPQPSAAADIAAAAKPAPTKDALEVIFATDASIHDGRFIDNAWLQEAPDPISKITWDNAALIAPKTAQALGIYDEIIDPQPKTKFLGIEGTYADVSPDGEGQNRKSPLITITLPDKRQIQIAALVSFGQAENTIILPVGYGQGYNEDNELGITPKNANHVGLVGVNTGFDVYPLRSTADRYFATSAKCKLEKPRAYPVALTQEHHAMYGRALAREISTVEDKKRGDFAGQLATVQSHGMDSHMPPNISLYKPEDRQGQPLINDPLHQWGMSIDLSSCMGCNACLVACQSENNIPVVGKTEAAKGREMHWIRMDRYFATQQYAFDKEGNKIKDKATGDYAKAPDWIADNPAMIPQPVACVHCEAAPCEVVCPVNATVHTEDGLNAMAYNRCIGTRYCANNCPYKARRFNFFDYNKRNPLIKHNLALGPLGERHDGEAPHLQRNPNVTVRMRGVMEKCTYCVQRLKDAVIRQKRGQKQEALVAGKPSTDIKVTDNTLRIPVDSVRTACQDACPANAITFGNLKDEEKSAMGRAKKIERNYDLLHYIGTLPRTSYLARVKNPNPAMPDAKYIGKATIHMH
jgi:molybdopterin-containing oxidoreductase family iron-sulfur binding subunit